MPMRQQSNADDLLSLQCAFLRAEWHASGVVEPCALVCPAATGARCGIRAESAPDSAYRRRIPSIVILAGDAACSELHGSGAVGRNRCALCSLCKGPLRRALSPTSTPEAVQRPLNHGRTVTASLHTSQLHVCERGLVLQRGGGAPLQHRLRIQPLELPQ